jgi:hypothetical protein
MIYKTRWSVAPPLIFAWHYNWVLVKTPRAQTHRDATRCSWWWMVESSRRWRVSCSLHVKDLYCGRKWIGALWPLRKIVRPYPTLYSFSVAVKSRWPDCPIPSFFYMHIYYIYYWTCPRPEYTSSWNTARWTLYNNHSIWPLKCIKLTDCIFILDR